MINRRQLVVSGSGIAGYDSIGTSLSKIGMTSPC